MSTTTPTPNGLPAVRALTSTQRLALARIVTLPFSEVCCHMRVAGERRPVLALTDGMAQILNPDGSPFSFPVCRGEAGLSHTDPAIAREAR